MIYTLAQIIEQSAARFPQKEAFRCLDDSVTYSELDVQSKQLADYLINAGLQKGDRVGILMNRCLDTATAVHGTFKSGGVFVPINPFMPINRIVAIMEDCGIAHLLTIPSQKKKIKSITAKAPFLRSVVGLEDSIGITTASWEAVFKRTLEDFSPPAILEQDLAFILYTSGSTGVPKGIMHTHYSGLSLAKLAADLHDFTSEDRVGNFAPLHFDPSTFGYFAAPMVGATTIIIPDAHLQLPASLSALVVKEKISVWYSVPLTLVQVLLHGDIDKHDFSCVRWVLFIGEVFPVKHLRALMLKWPHAQFNNLYGPAETVACTYYILPEPPDENQAVPIGNAWGNTEYKILDKNDNEVAQGEAGELVVRTATLMAGYWNNEALTAKSFFKLKQAAGYEHTYYRTGDLVKENEKSELMFLGRNDRQIKLRGYRIELDEIEVTLLRNENVEEAAVVLINKEDDEQELEAVVRLVAGASINPEELQTFCKAYIPGYSIPKTLRIMEDFPRTGSGKIDRNEIVKMLETSIS